MQTTTQPSTSAQVSMAIGRSISMSTGQKSAISLRILVVSARNGGDIAAAIDEVLGAGTYLRLAGEVYDTLRAKA